MESVENYENRIIDMFFVSIDNDINKWTKSDSMRVLEYYSPEYDRFKLYINMKQKSLYIYNIDSDTYTFITNYSFFRFLFNTYNSKKIRKYVKKLKYNFVNREEMLENENKISIMKLTIDNIEKTYLKEIRKEKLDNINNN